MKDLKQQIDEAAAGTEQMISGYGEMLKGLGNELRRQPAFKSHAKTGDLAPDFSLPSATGSIVSLYNRLEAGPVILTFYRGNWCPYCNLELRAYQSIMNEVTAKGASVIAISPQSPDDSLSTLEKEQLPFDVLSDIGCVVAAAYGIAFEAPPDLKQVHTQFGLELPEVNGADDWLLPIPATFVIGTDKAIRLAHVDPDYRNRLEPSDALAAL